MPNTNVLRSFTFIYFFGTYLDLHREHLEADLEDKLDKLADIMKGSTQGLSLAGSKGRKSRDKLPPIRKNEHDVDMNGVDDEVDGDADDEDDEPMGSASERAAKKGHGKGSGSVQPEYTAFKVRKLVLWPRSCLLRFIIGYCPAPLEGPLESR